MRPGIVLSGSNLTYTYEHQCDGPHLDTPYKDAALIGHFRKSQTPTRSFAAGGTLPGGVDIRDAPPPPARSAARRGSEREREAAAAQTPEMRQLFAE